MVRVCWGIEFDVQTEVWRRMWNRNSWTEHKRHRQTEKEKAKVWKYSLRLILNYHHTVRPIEETKLAKLLEFINLFYSALYAHAKKAHNHIYGLYLCLCVQILAKVRGLAKTNKTLCVLSPCEWCWQFHDSILFLPSSFAVSFKWILRFVIVHFHTLLLALALCLSLWICLRFHLTNHFPFHCCCSTV